jgi:hypothetical protein
MRRRYNKDGKDVTEFPACPVGRGSGRTQWMIERLCESIQAGQPKSLVFGHSYDFTIHHLKPRVIDKLKSLGMEVIVKNQDTIEVEGSVVIFCGAYNPKKVFGIRGAGHFYDHFYDEDYDAIRKKG